VDVVSFTDILILIGLGVCFLWGLLMILFVVGWLLLGRRERFYRENREWIDHRGTLDERRQRHRKAVGWKPDVIKGGKE
jgi:hypothetical protein